MYECRVGHTFCDDHITWKEGVYAFVPKMLHYGKGVPMPVAIKIVKLLPAVMSLRDDDDTFSDNRHAIPTDNCPGKIACLFYIYFFYTCSTR